MSFLIRATIILMAVGILSAQQGGRGGGGGFPGRGRGAGPADPQQGAPQFGQQGSQQTPPAPSKPEDLGSIEGQVSNAATGEPLRKATVSLRGLNGRGQPMAITSDAAGHFLLTAVEPGRYRLFAERNGFVRQEYGARAPERPGTAVNIDKAQKVTAIALRLTPQAVITGRIVDEDGDPVRNVSVQAMRMGYNQGRRQLISAGNVQTNDLGEYRLYDIPGGKYYVSAMLRSIVPLAAGKERYVPAYYPGATDPAAAAQLDVPAGTQLRGIDLTLRRAPTVAVRGKIFTAGSSTPSRGSSVRLVTRGSNLSMTLGQAGPGRGQGGNFEITGVTPGSYSLIVDSAQGRGRYTYRQPIEVGSGGIDGLTVTVPAPADLAGAVRLDGQGDVDFSRLNLSLRLKEATPGGAPNGRAKVDGSFTIEGVMPDSYELTIGGLPTGYYVKSVRYGADETLDSGLNLTNGVAGKLDIVLSPAAAQVEGIVRSAKQELAKAVLVALIPEAAKRSRTALFKTARTDENGHYTIDSITPGDYTLYAFEDIDSGAYFDPDFLKPIESSATSVNLRESAHEVRDLKEIPATE